MGTAQTLGDEYLETEIVKTTARLKLYTDLYHADEIACIKLRRLLNLKETELEILRSLHKELKQDED